MPLLKNMLASKNPLSLPLDEQFSADLEVAAYFKRWALSCLGIRCAILLSLSVSISSSYAAESSPVALADPIPEAIVFGDISVNAVDFIRAPKTEDNSDEAANAAYARIQYLLPANDGSGRLFLNDIRGLLYVSDESGSVPRVYLDIRSAGVGFDASMYPNEAGFMGFAFHPEFSQAGKPGFGKFYTGISTGAESGQADYLDDLADSHESVIHEWTTTDPGADTFSGSVREVFRIGQFSDFHNIGTLLFNHTAAEGSADYGKLYVSFGDGGGAFDPESFGQSLSEPMAGIIRIDPLARTADKAYGIPDDNPFVNEAGVAPEIWAYGLRHAQQFSFANDGRIFIGDIGQTQIEEVNIGVAGANYGWSQREGTFATYHAFESARRGPVYGIPAIDDPRYVYPVAQYDHDEGRAISGGFVYAGSAIPALKDKYVFTDLVAGRIFYIDTNNLNPGDPATIRELRVRVNGGDKTLLETGGFPNTYTSGSRAGLRLGVDSQGELYALTRGDGWIRKLLP